VVVVVGAAVVGVVVVEVVVDEGATEDGATAGVTARGLGAVPGESVLPHEPRNTSPTSRHPRGIGLDGQFVGIQRIGLTRAECPKWPPLSTGRTADRCGLDETQPGAKTGAVSTVEPWFTKPWPSTASRPRSRSAVFAYLGAGLCFLVMCLLSSAGPASRVLILLVALLFLGLGSSLAATLIRRRGA
jgi:hypothetical protein